MRHERRLSRLEAQSDLQEPGERVQLFISFVSPDGTQEADFVKLDDEGLCLHRRSDETIEMFKERVYDELRLIDEQSNIPRRAPVRVIVFRCNSQDVDE
jgi:hypothetical protein